MVFFKQMIFDRKKEKVHTHTTLFSKFKIPPSQSSSIGLVWFGWILLFTILYLVHISLMVVKNELILFYAFYKWKGHQFGKSHEISEISAVKRYTIITLNGSMVERAICFIANIEWTFFSQLIRLSE